MKKVCKLRNWKAQLVSDGKEVLEAFERNSFDLILMDMQMPGISGYDITRMIRNKEKITGKHIPIIATTSYTMGEDAKRCLEAGMDDYISKPINVNKLYNLIEKWTGTQKYHR